MPRNYDGRPKVDHGPKSSRMKLNEYFVDGHRIHEDVIHSEIERYLGAGAYARPGSSRGVQGYFVTAIRPFTPRQLDDLQAESGTYEEEQRRRPGRQEQPYRAHGDERPKSRPQYPPPATHVRTNDQPYLQQAGLLPQPIYMSRPEPNYQLGGQYPPPYTGASGQPSQYPYSPYQNRDQYPSGSNPIQNPLPYQPPPGYGVALQTQPQAMPYPSQTMQTPYSPQDGYAFRTAPYSAAGQHNSPGRTLMCPYQECTYVCQRQGELDRHLETHGFQPSVGGKRGTRG